MLKRSVVISAAGSSIGAACVARFAKAGDNIVLADKNEVACVALRDDLLKRGIKASFVNADMSEKIQVHNVIAEALDAHQRIDCLVHISLFDHVGRFLDTEPEEFDRVVQMNLRGAFLINQAVARQMVRQTEAGAGDDQPAGAIVNIHAADALVTSQDRVAFAAAQAGVHQMSKGVAIALSGYGIRANAVGVGIIGGGDKKTRDQAGVQRAVPLNRVGEPADVAEAAYFLTSPAAAFITGQTIYVDGGSLARGGLGLATAPEKAERSR